jgi:hypothetical protein
MTALATTTMGTQTEADAAPDMNSIIDSVASPEVNGTSNRHVVQQAIERRMRRIAPILSVRKPLMSAASRNPACDIAMIVPACR